MKKLLSISVLSLFVSDAFADDWRMRKFDLNGDDYITKAELVQSGCKKVGQMFDYADKNSDNLLNVREARKATHLIFKARCPSIVVPTPAIDIRG